MVYSLDTSLEEWVADHRKELEASNNLTLEEILSQHLRIRSNDKEIDNEIINAAEKVLNAATSDSYGDGEIPDTTLIAQVESIKDPLIYQLTHLVLRRRNVLNYILHEYEMFKNEDEMEIDDGT
jgi:Fic family protein